MNLGGDLGADKTAAASLRAPLAPARPAGEGPTRLSLAARILLWDFERGSPAYDLLIVFLILVLAAVPGAWWADPMTPRP
jgi:hypothetical protein